MYSDGFIQACWLSLLRASPFLLSSSNQRLMAA